MESRLNSVGDPHQQEANRLEVRSRKCVTVKPQIGHAMDLLYPRSHILALRRGCVEAQTEVTQGTAHVLKTPTLTSWLTQTQRATRAQHMQTGL